jgi:hypothetical protein
LSWRNSLYATLAKQLRAQFEGKFVTPPRELAPAGRVGLKSTDTLWGPTGTPLAVADDLPLALFGVGDRLRLGVFRTTLRWIPNNARETRWSQARSEVELLDLVGGGPPIHAWPDAVSDRGWARLFTHGPIASAVERRGDELIVDLSILRGLPRHPGLEPIGCVAAARLVDGHAAPSWIELEHGRRLTPGEAGWGRARLISTCAMHTWLVVVRHLVHVHYMANGALATVVQNHLPASHPLRPLLEPHLVGALAVNHRANHTLVGRHGAVQGSYSFAFEGVAALIGRAVEQFRFDSFDVPAELERRGLTELVDAGHLPNSEDARSLWAAIDDYVGAYLDLYYADDAALAADATLQRCLDQLAGLVPRPPAYATLGELRRLLTRVIVAASVEHQLVGGSAWHFLTLPYFMPHRVYPGLSVEQSVPYREESLANLTAKWATSARSYRLMADWSHLASDERARAVMRRFQGSLARVGEAIDQRNRERAVAFDHLHPRHLDSSAAI